MSEIDCVFCNPPIRPGNYTITRANCCPAHWPTTTALTNNRAGPIVGKPLPHDDGAAAAEEEGE